MNRRCVRCKLLQHIDYMHYSRQWNGWLCNNKINCTQRLENKEVFKW